MHRVEDAPSRSQTEGAMREWLQTFVPQYKISGSTGTGVTAHAGAGRPRRVQAASIKPRNSMFNDGGVPKGIYTFCRIRIGRVIPPV